MKIYGIDFTSAPGARKPITWAQCHFEGDVLQLETSGGLRSFAEFEAFLAQPGPWYSGIDFPFGQPHRLIENIGWPQTWEGYVRYLAGFSKEQFVRTLEQYRQNRPPGDKQHLRRTDQAARSCSPMMLYGVPVGKMFFEGAHRLLDSGASILPVRPNEDPRIVLEAYPALIARRWAGSRSYKNDQPAKQTLERKTARRDIINGMRSEAKQYFGFSVQFPELWAEDCIRDGTGDRLDALLCAIQAGWAYSRHDQNFGLPPDCDPLEGWIVDPLLLEL